MNEDKKLSKKIQSEFEKPDVDFEEWADKNNIKTGSAGFVPNRQESIGRTKSSPVIALKRGLIAVVPIMLALAIALPLVLINVFSVSSEPKIYGAGDAMSVDIELDEIRSIDDVFLFDMTSVVKTELITKDVLKKDNKMTLCYTLTNCLLSVDNGSILNGFYLTYKIRIYTHYEFLKADNYTNLVSTASVNGKSVAYALQETDNIEAYAKFTVGDYEYFIQARGFPGITELNEQNFLNLLNKVLI